MSMISLSHSLYFTKVKVDVRKEHIFMVIFLFLLITNNTTWQFIFFLILSINMCEYSIYTIVRNSVSYAEDYTN